MRMSGAESPLVGRGANDGGGVARMGASALGTPEHFDRGDRREDVRGASEPDTPEFSLNLKEEDGPEPRRAPVPPSAAALGESESGTGSPSKSENEGPPPPTDGAWSRLPGEDKDDLVPPNPPGGEGGTINSPKSAGNSPKGGSPSNSVNRLITTARDLDGSSSSASLANKADNGNQHGGDKTKEKGDDDPGIESGEYTGEDGEKLHVSESAEVVGQAEGDPKTQQDLGPTERSMQV